MGLPPVAFPVTVAHVAVGAPQTPGWCWPGRHRRRSRRRSTVETLIDGGCRTAGAVVGVPGVVAGEAPLATDVGVTGGRVAVAVFLAPARQGHGPTHRHRPARCRPVGWLAGYGPAFVEADGSGGADAGPGYPGHGGHVGIAGAQRDAECWPADWSGTFRPSLILKVGTVRAGGL